MNPQRLTLKNFIGIRAGLGLESLELDLEALGDAQLIALKGPNGAGKSTILDNLHPYRVMPSRAGSYSPASFSYYDQTTGDAEKLLEWEHDGRRYRSQLLIKGTGKTKKTDAYLFDITNGAPVALSDGKTATYDAAVEAVLGSPEMFFTAAFSAQGRRSLSAYKNSEIKGLMSELLGLDHILELSGRAAQVVKLYTARLVGLQQQLAEIVRKEENTATHESEIRIKESALVALEAEQQGRRQAVVQAAEAVATAKADAKQAADIEARRTRLSGAVTEAQTRAGARVTEIRKDIARENAAKAAREADYKTAITAAQAAIDATATRRTNSLERLARRNAIEEAAAELPTLEEMTREAESQVETSQAAADEVATLNIERGELAGQLHALGSDGKNLADYVDGLLRRAKLADEVPCGGTELLARCPLMADAVTAKEEIPAKTADRNEKRAEYATIQERGNALAVRIAEYGDVSGVLIASKQLRDRYAKTLAGMRELAALAPTLAAAQLDLDQATAEEAEKRQQINAAIIAHVDAIAVIDAHVQELGARAAKVEEDAAAEVLAIQEQLAEIPATVGAAAVSQAEAVQLAAVQRVEEIERQIQAARDAISTAKGKADALRAELTSAAAVRAESAKVSAEIAEWRLLAAALGNDGIIALSIDDAGPTLASLANDLLLSCYGPRFTVSIQTQSETAKGDQRETFDILVFDGERDESKSVRDMSGGERVYINDTLTRAIALYQAQQSGRHYGTLFADESDGALDPERKVQFMRMKRRILEIGGYAREILITHTPELIDLADAVVDLGEMRAA